MIDALARPAVEWLAATGAPNWVVLVALLTSAWTWSSLIRERLSALASKVMPGGGKATTAETPDDDPRE